MSNRTAAAEAGVPSRWERVRWPEAVPMPRPGHELVIGRTGTGAIEATTCVVLDSRMDFEPGWIQVEITDCPSS